MPDASREIISIQPDGNRIVLPAQSGTDTRSIRIELRGTLRCAYDGLEYDAVYRYRPGAPVREAVEHATLAWQPRAPQLVEAEFEAHRYVFWMPAFAAGTSADVRVDVDRLVDEFLIPPSEVRLSLSGRFEATVDPPVEAAPWPAAFAAAPALALAAGVGWVIQRRMRAAALDFDLEAQVARIAGKAEAARAAVTRADGRLAPIRARLRAVEAGAETLARQIQQLRGARRLHSEQALQRDAAALEQRLQASGLSEEEALTLADKRRSLDALASLERSEQRLAARLNRLEAVVESALASLQTVRAGAMEPPVRESLCRSLDAEVRALREARGGAGVSG
ncbi:MAG TPA: hypothetical protein VKT77_12810 [Chthonomonadaceae bacterium]|nr:hypothetical protein [Chthonomonadaceae bacterium]